jgi:uncharacterized protein (DUF427 family)
MATQLREPRRNGRTFEPSARWVRGISNEVPIVDSKHPLLVWEPGRPIVSYAFPRAEVAGDLLTPTGAPSDAVPGRNRYYHVISRRPYAKRCRDADPDLLAHHRIAEPLGQHASAPTSSTGSTSVSRLPTA